MEPEDALAGSLADRSSVDITKIVYRWENQVLILTPTVEDWADFPGILRCARHHGGHLAGVIKVEMPKYLQQKGPQVLTLDAVEGLYTYQVKNVAGANGLFQIEQPRSLAPLDLSTPANPHAMSTTEALAQMGGPLEDE